MGRWGKENTRPERGKTTYFRVGLWGGERKKQRRKMRAKPQGEPEAKNHFRRPKNKEVQWHHPENCLHKGEV